MATPQDGYRPKPMRISDLQEVFVVFDVKNFKVNHDSYTKICAHGTGKDPQAHGRNLLFSLKNSFQKTGELMSLNGSKNKFPLNSFYGLKTEGFYPGGGLVVVKLFSLKKKVSPRVCGRRSFCKLPGFPRNHNSRKKFHHYQQLFSVSD